MSFQLMAWAAQQTTGSPTRKAVLLALANRANHDTGLCCPSIEAICAETEYGRSAVKQALSDLADGGVIHRTRRRRPDGSLGTYEYRFPTGPADGLPGSAGDPRPEAAGDPRNQEVPNQETPECVEASVLTLTAKEPQHVPRAREQKLTGWKVDRSPVTLDQANAAGRILDEWNEQTGQQLRSRDWLAKIVMRIREHPDLTVTDHAHVIWHALAHPWWDGPPSPSVVYGSGAQFERALTCSRAPVFANGNGNGKRRYGYGVTSSELGQWAAQLRSEGR